MSHLRIQMSKTGEHTKKRILYIVNPKSGTGGKAAIEEAIRTQTDSNLFDWQIRHTERAGHAAEIAREAAQDGVDVVVAVGGDGTVNEVARSLVHTETALAILPCGSGNGLARHLRIPMVPDEALKLINECSVANIDYGTINGEAFFCTCGVGFDAFISMKFAEAGRRGLSTYVEKTLQDGITYRPETYRIEIDGVTEEQEAFLIACANASQYGNNAYIAPDASTRDGLLDVTILTPFTPLDAPQIVVQLFNRKLTKNSHVKIFRTEHLTIRRSSAGPAHVDGDPVTMGDTLDVRLVAGGLKMVVNGHPGHRPLAFPVVQNVGREIEGIQRELEGIQRDIERTFFRNIFEPFHKLDEYVKKLTKNNQQPPS